MSGHGPRRQQRHPGRLHRRRYLVLLISSEALARCAESAQLVINPIVYAEVSVRFPTIEELERALPASVFKRDQLPWEAAFVAGKCFLDYRKRGGARHAPLPDVYIGAHAALSSMTLLTRDAARYRTYFPKLRVIAP